MPVFIWRKVHLCEIESPQDLPNLEFPFNVRKGRPLLVAVKILRPDASKNARSVTSYTAVPGVSAVHSFSFLEVSDIRVRKIDGLPRHRCCSSVF